MTREYTPDRWVVLKFSSEEHGTSEKLFSGWSGSYLYGESWKLSSGIVKVEDKGDYYEFHNHSGSIYKCYKTHEGMSGYMRAIYAGFVEQMTDNTSVEVVEEWNKCDQ